MCNACGNYCCGSDMFGGCGCDGCYCEDCWSEDDKDEGDEFMCEPVDTGDELHQILGEALNAAKAAR